MVFGFISGKAKTSISGRGKLIQSDKVFRPWMPVSLCVGVWNETEKEISIMSRSALNRRQKNNEWWWAQTSQPAVAQRNDQGGDIPGVNDDGTNSVIEVN